MSRSSRGGGNARRLPTRRGGDRVECRYGRQPAHPEPPVAPPIICCIEVASLCSHQIGTSRDSSLPGAREGPRWLCRPSAGPLPAGRARPASAPARGTWYMCKRRCRENSSCALRSRARPSRLPHATASPATPAERPAAQRPGRPSGEQLVLVRVVDDPQALTHRHERAVPREGRECPSPTRTSEVCAAVFLTSGPGLADAGLASHDHEAGTALEVSTYGGQLVHDDRRFAAIGGSDPTAVGAEACEPELVERGGVAAPSLRPGARGCPRRATRGWRTPWRRWCGSSRLLRRGDGGSASRPGGGGRGGRRSAPGVPPGECLVAAAHPCGLQGCPSSCSQHASRRWWCPPGSLPRPTDFVGDALRHLPGGPAPSLPRARALAITP